MENIVVEEPTTATKKLERLPAPMGSTVVKGSETVVHDSEQAVVKASTSVVDPTKTVAVEVTEGSQELGRDVEDLVAPESNPMKPKSMGQPVEVAA